MWQNSDRLLCVQLLDHFHSTWFPPMFRHNDVTAHLITEQTAVMDDQGFQNEC